MNPLHERALVAAKRFRHEELALLDILQEIDGTKIYLEFGFPSLFQYCLNALKLSEANSSNFIVVARKSMEVPELKIAVGEGRISVAKARKITPVITPQNKDHWISLAETLPKDKLEAEVARVKPGTGTCDSTRHLDGEFSELKIKVRNLFLEKLKQAQDVACQKTQTSAGYAATLELAIDLFLCDAAAPVHRTRKFKILLRDSHRCTFTAPDGNRCSATRWLDIHHVIPREQGGDDSPENLVTLCSAHHKYRHRSDTV